MLIMESLLLIVHVHMILLLGRTACRSKSSGSKSLPLAEVLLAVVVLISLCAPVQRCPFRLLLEQAHSLDVLRLSLAIQLPPDIFVSEQT